MSEERAARPSTKLYDPADELNLHLKGRAQVSDMSGGSHRHTGWSGNHTALRVVKPPSLYSQQSVVVVELVSKGSMRSGAKTTVPAHEKYLQEEKAQEQGQEQRRAVMFDKEQDQVRTMHDMAVERAALPAEDKAGRDALRQEMNHSWAMKVNGERHHFRIIVSPQNSAQMNMEKHVRDLMSEMERDQGTKLDWRATIHRDTKQVHAQIILRGKRDDGRTLYLDREYISKGIRHRSQELATKELGLRHRTAAVAQQEKALEQERQLNLRTLAAKQNKGQGKAQENGIEMDIGP